MTINEWESLLEKFKRSPDKDIQQILKVSYDDLNDFEKEIFLDIACFFRGQNIEDVKNMVKHVYDFDPSHGIRVLVNKCLIKVQYSHVKMHDLMQDMGREIVRQESPKELGKRSILWLHQDIVHVLEDNTGTSEVNITIQDNWLKCMEVDWDGEAFKSMKNLKVLIFNNVTCSKSLKYLPNSLKVLKWQGYPSSSLPADFRPKKLVEFNIGYSNLSSMEIVRIQTI
ncbi:disease resistance protein RPP2B-like [Prosopis cineraria]|uniref:disease resistance protein RPP2B-like n=1 Tax=Prosopis cineraria TaxID=364024 RepID=UPI00240F4CFA|nr:disease resistance protein RPP2B-like [Prosopis cineraria]